MRDPGDYLTPEIADESVFANEMLGPEDQDLCESEQRGLRSHSYGQGA